MPDFTYIARNPKGEKVTGRLAATTEREVVALLDGQSLFPIDVAEEKARVGGLFGRRVGGQVMATTYNQMASLLRSGVPLLRSLRVLRDQSSNKVLKVVLDEVYRKVEDGMTLGDAMAQHTGVFNEMAVSMVRAGGEGGFLEDALDRVAQFTEEQEDLKARTAGALAYPAFLAVVGTGIVTVLVVFFVPRFATMFDRLRSRGELPVLTDWLLWFSKTVNQYWWVMLIIAAAASFLLYLRMKTEAGRRMSDLVKLKIPLVGSIFQALAVARFCRVLGTLLTNGVPILKSLDISREAAGNRILSEAIERASDNISAGESLAGPLGSSGYFPMTVVEMISVAEESNTLDTVLVEVADGLEKRTSRRLDLVVRLLEPIMLLILAGIVLMVVIALLLPVIKMSSTV